MDIDESVDKLLIDCVKNCPSLHNTDIYSTSDEREWDKIQKSLGIHSNVVYNNIYIFGYFRCFHSQNGVFHILIELILV